MTRYERQYRFQMAPLGDTDFSGSLITYGEDRIKELPSEWGGQDIRPLSGRTSHHDWTITIADVDKEVTADLADSDGRPHLLTRLARIQMSNDGGSTWTTQATGRVASVELSENVANFRFSIESEWSYIMDKQLYGTTSAIGSDTVGDGTTSPEATTSILPPGVINRWSTLEPVGTVNSSNEAKGYIVFEVTDVTGNVVTMKGEPATFVGPDYNTVTGLIPDVNRRVIEEDLKTGVGEFDPDDVNTSRTAGDFQHLRMRVKGVGGSYGDDATHAATDSDYELLAPGLFDKEGNVGKSKETDNGNTYRTIDEVKVKVIWQGNQPSVGQNVRAFVYGPGMEVSRQIPLHIGGAIIQDGLSLAMSNAKRHGELVKNIMTDAGARFDDSTADSVDQRRRENLYLIPRLEGPITVGRWLQKHVLRSAGLFIYQKENGELALGESFLPTEDQISDVTSLTKIDASKAAGPDHPTFVNTRQEHVSVLDIRKPERRIVFTPQKDRTSNDMLGLARGNATEAPSGADSIFNEEGDIITRRHRSGKIGPSREEITLRHVFEFTFLPAGEDTSFFNQWVDDLTEFFFDRFGDGALRTSLIGMQATESITANQFVTLDLSTFPNLNTQDRGGIRVFQVMSAAYDRFVGTRIDLLDVGPDQQPLPAPSVSATSSGSTTIDVTVGGNSGTGSALDGDRFTLEIAKNNTQPSTGSDLWGPVNVDDPTSQQTITVDQLEPGTTYWFRARQHSPDRITSDYSSADSASTDTLGAPSGASIITNKGCFVEASWTNDDDNVRTEILLDGNRVAVRPPGATRVLVLRLQTSTSYTLTFRHIGPHGGTSPDHTLDFTTDSTAATGPDIGATFVLVG